MLSRISNDSIRSEAAQSDAKKKRSIMGKLKQLTKSRSIEDSDTANQLVNAGIKVQNGYTFVFK